jgi:hypothetical protein
VTPKLRKLDLVVALLVVLPVWICDPLPLQDLPSHEQVVAAMAHGLDWTGFAERLRMDWSPRAYALVYFVWAGLAKVFGVSTSSRLLLTFALGGGLLAMLQWIRTLDPRKQDRALLAGLLVFSEFYYLGFVQLLVSLPFGFLLLARRTPPRDTPRPLRDEAVDALLLLAAYLCHPLGGFPAGVILVAFALRSRTKTPEIARALGRLLLVALPCVLWHGAIALWARPRGVPVEVDGAFGFLPPLKAGAAILCYPLASHGTFYFWLVGGAARVLALVNLCAWGVALLALFWRGGSVAERPPRPGLGLAVCTLLAFVFVFPDHWRDHSILSLRGLLFLFPLLLAWAPVREETRASRILTGVALALCLLTAYSAHFLAAGEFRRLDPVLAAMEPKASVLPITVLDPNVKPERSRVLLGYILDLHANTAMRYHVQKGGLGPSIGAIALGNSPVEIVDPLPRRVDPVYRYLIAPSGAVRGARGYREIETSSRYWSLFERIP